MTNPSPRDNSSVVSPGTDDSPIYYVDTRAELESLYRTISRGTGPLAVDTERAGSFRYNDRAFLIQLHREGAGTFVIDAEALRRDLPTLGKKLASIPWILHASHTDLPCLLAIGWQPQTLYDTQLAARLLGLKREGLGPLVEEFFGFSLDKTFGGKDWSARPLPDDMIAYAADDVEFLVELHGLLLARLERAGRLDWYRQECAVVLDNAQPLPPQRVGCSWYDYRDIKKLSDRGRHVFAHLWQARDTVAMEFDIAPEKLFRAVQLAMIADRPQHVAVQRVKSLTSRQRSARALRLQKVLTAAVNSAHKVPRRQWYQVPASANDPRRALSRWRKCNPDIGVLDDELSQAHTEVARELGIRRECVAPTITTRLLAWQLVRLGSPAWDDAQWETAVAVALEEQGLRPWQVGILAPVLIAPLREHVIEATGHLPSEEIIAQLFPPAS